jgi:hypothetical protein
MSNAFSHPVDIKVASLSAHFLDAVRGRIKAAFGSLRDVSAEFATGFRSEKKGGNGPEARTGNEIRAHDRIFDMAVFLFR